MNIYQLPCQDIPRVPDVVVVLEAPNLHMIKNRQWSIFKTSAIKDHGLFEGLNWYDTLWFHVFPSSMYSEHYYSEGPTFSNINCKLVILIVLCKNIKVCLALLFLVVQFTSKVCICHQALQHL